MTRKSLGQKSFNSTRKYYSIIDKLERENLIDEKTQLVLRNLALEDIIAVKLELCARSVRTGFFIGIPIWNSLVNIARDAVLKFALSCSRSRLDGARFLGISFWDFQFFTQKYHTFHYFSDNSAEQKLENSIPRNIDQKSN